MEGIEDLQIRPDGQDAIVCVKVVPGSSRDRVAGMLGDCLKITTAAAAEKGKANAAVARTLAKALGAKMRDVELVSGRTSPHKEFRVLGRTPEQVRRVLSEPGA